MRANLKRAREITVLSLILKELQTKETVLERVIDQAVGKNEAVPPELELVLKGVRDLMNATENHIISLTTRPISEKLNEV